MIDIKAMLEAKWGEFISDSDSYYKFNGPMPFISNETKLNVLFNHKGISDIKKIYSTYLDTDVPHELLGFYKKFNGVRLFANSLSVYGIQDYSSKDYQPYDILICNRNSADYNKCGLILVASIGGEYNFGFKRNELSKIYGIQAGNGEIIQTFDSFDTFFEHYFCHLIDEYGYDCRKIHINEEYKGIPVLEHLSYELIE